MVTDRKVYIHLHDRDSYGYDADVAGYLRIDAFAVYDVMHQQPQLVITKTCPCNIQRLLKL